MTEAEQMNPDLIEIDNLLQAEDFNFGQSRILLADSFSLVEDVVHLYDTLTAMNREFGVSMADTFPTTQFLLESRARLVRAEVEACRGYLTESFWHSRRANEYAPTRTISRKTRRPRRSGCEQRLTTRELTKDSGTSSSGEEFFLGTLRTKTFECSVNATNSARSRFTHLSFRWLAGQRWRTGRFANGQGLVHGTRS
jgi:hypothetical protein